MRSTQIMKKLAPSAFYGALTTAGVDSFYGVPDSLLKDFCAYVTDTAPPTHHTITANEGCAVGMATGYHMATGRIGAVYLQNSGLGNMFNPLLSIAHHEVYRVPMLIIMGWRGEPNVKDEPQHVAQGRLTPACLDVLEVAYAVLPNNAPEALGVIATAVGHMKATSRPYCLLVKKDTFESYKLTKGRAKDATLTLTREDAIGIVAAGAQGPDVFFVSTTGMASRELYEFRAKNKQSHASDFLTVGGMGHCSQIAAGMAMGNPKITVVCVDGDGAAIMHLGGISTIGNKRSQMKKLKHVVINNGAHDSVGGQPTAAFDSDLSAIAKSCGYSVLPVAKTEAEAKAGVVAMMAMEGPVLLEIRVKTGSRADLGRPKGTPEQNKTQLMERISNL